AALKSNRINYLLLVPFLISYAWHILMMARKADLIWANWAVSGALAWFLSPFHHKPVVTVLRGSDAVIKEGELASKSFQLLAAIRGSKAVVCVGEDLGKAVKTITGSPEKVRHIPNGIHEQFFQVPPPAPEDVINIIFAGSLVPDKDVDILLKAVDRLKHLSLRLLIAGQGPSDQELRNLAKSLKIEHLVTFQGQISPGSHMAEMMSRAHFLVLPSHHEGRPNVVLEAMAAGRPVIGTDIEGIRELVKHTETGLLFPKGDIKVLSEAIERLVENPELLIRMGRSARQWVLDQGFSWDYTASKYIELFKRVIES
ncbi:MAG: glycosyltransferase family 4 protein, partial [Deltaproteobacteria bacterium]|nr:glycosyltransferase family 4 protein [Deltaproteobacteria bacterium]MBW2053924.1 glycosyltransferase family 4 protein [Deltaproteobacteria bacterium]